MPAAARGNGRDVVASRTGTGINCELPVTTSTDGCSPNVFTNGIGSVREGDRVAPHRFFRCRNDGSVLTTFSPNVFVNGRGFGRLGDQYTPDNTITTGSSNVFVNG
jgi:uncharacterized Zn-binding protein involved in type VI secretion